MSIFTQEARPSFHSTSVMAAKVTKNITTNLRIRLHLERTLSPLPHKVSPPSDNTSPWASPNLSKAAATHLFAAEGNDLALQTIMDEQNRLRYHPPQGDTQYRSRESTVSLGDDENANAAASNPQILPYLEFSFDSAPNGSRGFEIGTDKDCDVVLPKLHRISRVHCAITFDEKRLLILRDFSKNGTVVEYDGQGAESRRAGDHFSWILGGHPVCQTFENIIIRIQGKLSVSELLLSSIKTKTNTTPTSIDSLSKPRGTSLLVDSIFRRYLRLLLLVEHRHPAVVPSESSASWRGYAYGETFLVGTNLRSLCKYNSQGISEQFRLDVNIDHWYFGFLDCKLPLARTICGEEIPTNTPALYENVSIQSINFFFRLVLFLDDILVCLFIPTAEVSCEPGEGLSGRKTYTSLTVLYVSGGSSALTSSAAAGTSGALCVELRDLRKSKHCWAKGNNSD